MTFHPVREIKGEIHSSSQFCKPVFLALPVPRSEFKEKRAEIGVVEVSHST